MGQIVPCLCFMNGAGILDRSRSQEWTADGHFVQATSWSQTTIIQRISYLHCQNNQTNKYTHTNDRHTHTNDRHTHTHIYLNSLSYGKFHVEACSYGKLEARAENLNSTRISQFVEILQNVKKSPPAQQLLGIKQPF